MKPLPIQRTELGMDELESILQRARASPLDEQDCAKIKAVFETYLYLTDLVEDKQMTIKRLRQMLFGASTEKTNKVIKKTNEEGESESASATSDDARAPPEQTEKQNVASSSKRKGHGRNGADAYTGAEKIRVPHESLQPGDSCPECHKGQVYEMKVPGVLVRIVGQAPVQAKVYELQKLRCHLCGKVFTAQEPEGVGVERYDATAASMIALLKYGSGLPFNRLEGLQGSLGIPLPASTQWDIVRCAAKKIELVYDELIRQAAQGELLHNDDTTMKVLEFMGKRQYLEAGRHADILANFTIDSPVPYDIRAVLAEIQRLDTEMVPGARAGTEKQGEFHGRLSRFIARLENKLNDRRLGFMFGAPQEASQLDWLPKLARLLLSGTRDQESGNGGVKIIDFSEVPSDVLPLIGSRFASLVFFVQQWTRPDNRQPIALFCDEAHLYMPNTPDAGGVEAAALRYFERIAKEGRKYGVGLVVISQRPAEVSRTVLSQCNNFVALRLTNAEDQNVIKRLLPDSLGGFTDLLPVLDTGEALVVGDASLLPSRIRIKEPTAKPSSGTVDFWDEWASDEEKRAIEAAVQAWRRQSLGPAAVGET